jgi:hypothetical protein
MEAMRDALHRCRSNFGEAPRRFSVWERLTYLRVPTPLWLRVHPADGLATLFRNLDSLYSDGTVVWGHVVQANSQLFEPGKRNLPGELVYSIEDRDIVEPGDLGDVAEALFELKGTTPDDPGSKAIADYLTDERVRVFGLPVPHSVSPSVRYRMSTVYFVRKHLPQGRLCSPLLPLLVHGREPHVALVLPERYWPRDFAAWWAEQ